MFHRTNRRRILMTSGGDEGRPPMRLVRFLLWLVAIGAVVVWSNALVHGFKGYYCVRTAGHTCTSDDLRFQGHVVVWLAPLVFLVSLWLVRVSKHYRFRFRQFSKRPVAQQQQPFGQQTAQLARPTAPRLNDGPANGPGVSNHPEGQQADPAPRHAAKDTFITMYDPPVNARPRHAAPEPEPEW
jgi:hypothetical protein